MENYFKASRMSLRWEIKLENCLKCAYCAVRHCFIRVVSSSLRYLLSLFSSEAFF